jgi:hypothetical protein
MPTVPSSNVLPFTGGPQAQQKVPDTFLMMAAADLHEAGRLFQPQGGQYIGDLGHDDDLSYDRSEPYGRRNGDTIERHTDPKEIMKKAAPDEEGYTLPDNPTLFIRKKKPGQGKDEALTS